MIPQQTESVHSSIRGYGCLMMVYVWFVAIKYNHEFLMREIEALFSKAIDQGIILDNDLPIDHTGGPWYRCWIADPVAWIKLVASSIGEVVYPHMIFKSPRKFEAADYYAIENISRYRSTQGVIKGIHFTGGAGMGSVEQEYNPDIRIDCIGLKSVRGWRI